MKKWMLVGLVALVALGVVAIGLSGGPDTGAKDDEGSFKKAWTSDSARASQDTAESPDGVETAPVADVKKPEASKPATKAVVSASSEDKPANPGESPPNLLMAFEGAAQPSDSGVTPVSDNKPSKPSGTLDREQIQEVVGQMKPSVKGCYNQLLKVFPQADGTVKLSFTIVAEDGVSHVDMEQAMDSSTLQEGEMHECMIGALREQDFPLPQGGDGSVKVTYPFNFTNDGE